MLMADIEESTDRLTCRKMMCQTEMISERGHRRPAVDWMRHLVTKMKHSVVLMTLTDFRAMEY